jgi:hypothetical protein
MKAKNFDYWDNLSRNQQLNEFNKDRIGLLWLKLKSIVRPELVNKFLDFSNFKIKTKKQNNRFKELFELLAKNTETSHKILDEYIKKISQEQIAKINIQKLSSELYRLKNFEWGGDHQNSLDKHLVSRYIKISNPSYDNLISKFETEINPIVQHYVLNSWYNYWSSILIENIFKLHSAILPTVG